MLQQATANCDIVIKQLPVISEHVTAAIEEDLKKVDAEVKSRVTELLKPKGWSLPFFSSGGEIEKDDIVMKIGSEFFTELKKKLVDKLKETNFKIDDCPHFPADSTIPTTFRHFATLRQHLKTADSVSATKHTTPDVVQTACSAFAYVSISAALFLAIRYRELTLLLLGCCDAQTGVEPATGGFIKRSGGSDAEVCTIRVPIRVAFVDCDCDV
jgi:hypothetical protein